MTYSRVKQITEKKEKKENLSAVSIRLQGAALMQLILKQLLLQNVYYYRQENLNDVLEPFGTISEFEWYFDRSFICLMI